MANVDCGDCPNVTSGCLDECMKASEGSMSDTPLTDEVALDQRDGVTHPDLCETYMAWTDYWALRERSRKIERDLAAARAEVENAERALLRHGYRKSCDIPACNCGDQWSHGGHASTRLRELSDALEPANGETLLQRATSLRQRNEELTGLLRWIDEAQTDALQEDFEHGVKWLSDNAANEFKRSMPALWAFLKEMSERIDRALNHADTPESSR